MLSVPPLPELCSPLFSTLSELPWLPVLPVHPNKAAQRLPWEQDTFLGQTPLHFPILYHISFPPHPHHHWPHHKLSTKWMCHHVLTSFIVPWGSCFHLVLLKTQRASEAKELIQKQRQKRSVMQGHSITKCFCICCHCIGLRAAFHLGNIQGPHRISSQAEVHRNDNIGKPKKRPLNSSNPPVPGVTDPRVQKEQKHRTDVQLPVVYHLPLPQKCKMERAIHKLWEAIQVPTD